MAFKVGTRVVMLTPDPGSSHRGIGTISEHVITKVSPRGDEVWVDNRHKLEDCIYSAYLWADTQDARLHLQRGIEMSRRHKAEEDQYMKDTYEQLNTQFREGLR